MKAIILAAGEGKRLRPLTNENPKCMIKLFGKSILETQIDIFKKYNIDKICVITGYQKEKINFKDVKYYFNKKYNSTNMVETLFCAEEEFNDTIIISYGDIIYEREIIKKMIENNENFSVVVDKNWQKLWKIRFENPLDDAESLQINNEGNISNIGQKTNSIEEIKGQFIGLVKIQGEGLKIFKTFYKKCKEKAKNQGINPLNPNVSFEKSYMTDFLQGLIKDNQKITPIFVNNGWLELDTVKDFKIYNKLFNTHKISEFINLENIK